MFVITGGGSGIGRALAQKLAEREQQVLIVGRRQIALDETASFSARIKTLCIDVVSADERQKLIEYLTNTSHIKGLIHNAGIIDPIMPMSEISEELWHKTLTTNLNAPFFLSQKLLNKLSQGRVLHIGSGAAYFPIAGWSAYCVSKAALAMLTQCWQLECSSVAFASVMPGIIDTPMQETIRQSQRMQPEKHDFFMRLKQNQQLISPETVAEFLCWLLLDIGVDKYKSQEWDIYDTTHHPEWLKAPYQVPQI